MHTPFRTVLIGAALLGATAWAADLSIEPPRVLEQPLWTYPLEASRDMIFEGQARVLVSISEEGEVLDFVVLGYTLPAFAQEVVTALPRIRFVPARVRGEVTTVRIPITFNFEQKGNVVSLSGSDQMSQRIARMMHRGGFQGTVCPGHELDGPLVPVNMISPLYPAELRQRRVEGEVMVDFYIDAEGKVRMPATAANAHPSFARSAIAAIEKWHFEPPTSGGAPVLVHARQLFRFIPPENGSGSPNAERVGGVVATAEPTDKRPQAERY